LAASFKEIGQSWEPWINIIQGRAARLWFFIGCEDRQNKRRRGGRGTDSSRGGVSGGSILSRGSKGNECKLQVCQAGEAGVDVVRGGAARLCLGRGRGRQTDAWE
jgi:hypothetical protein